MFFLKTFAGYQGIRFIPASYLLYTLVQKQYSSLPHCPLLNMGWQHTTRYISQSKAAVTHNEINESIATVKKTRLFVSLNRPHCTEILSMSCKAIVSKTAVIVFVAMIKVIAVKLVKFLIAKLLKLDHRYLISTICMLLFACRIFSANNIAIEKVFLKNEKSN